MAPMNASAPPAAHTASIAGPYGTICATITGTKKMPPPITFETTIAAASNGPRRRSSDGGGGRCGRRGRVGEVVRHQDLALLREQLTNDLHLVQLDPLRRALLREDLRFHVAELAVLQHVGAGLRRVAGVAALRPHGDRAWSRRR